MDYDPDVHEKCLDELLRLTKGLRLPFPADEICKRRMWFVRDDKGHLTPYPGVTFWPLQEAEAPGTMSREDIGYGCGCAVVIPSDHALKSVVGKSPYCRARIRRKVIHQRLDVTQTGMTYLTTKVAHLQINQPLLARFEASLLRIVCWMRETRG